MHLGDDVQIFFWYLLNRVRENMVSLHHWSTKSIILYSESEGRSGSYFLTNVYEFCVILGASPSI